MATAEQLEPRVTKLETTVETHELKHAEHRSAIADLQSSQRDDAESRGLLLSLRSSVDALANGHRELARQVSSQLEAEASRRAESEARQRRSPVQAASPAIALFANILVQSITGKDAASAEALSTSLVVLLVALFGPYIEKWFPKKEPQLDAAKTEVHAETKSQANGVAPDDKELH